MISVARATVASASAHAAIGERRDAAERHLVDAFRLTAPSVCTSLRTPVGPRPACSSPATTPGDPELAETLIAEADEDAGELGNEPPASLGHELA